MFLNQKSSLVAAVVITMTFLVVGCSNEVAVETKAKALPKLDFHKPANFAAAVKRIRELHDAIASSDALPDPVSYTVVEVSHSHGEGKAHVHYHLDEPGDHDHGHDHDEGDHDHDHGDHDHGDHDDHSHPDPFDKPIKHTVSVDAFTELKDIVRWLPAIASDGDLPQETWNQAKTISEEMTNSLEKVLLSDDPSTQRTSYQSDTSVLEKSITALESLLPPATDETKAE
jgi:ABC-type Zn2+ transport system substrate-binding protein/surface adhesin